MLSLRACVAVLALVVACDKKSDNAKPAEAVKPAETKRVDLGSGEAKPPDPKPPEAKPTEAKPPEDKPPEAKADPFAAWTERKGDGFSVLAPQDPKVQTKETTATGKPLPTTMYTHYVPDGQGAVQIMFTELDKTSKLDGPTMFDAMKESMLKQFSGTVKKEKEITVGKAKGREYWLDGDHPRMGKLRVHVKFLLSDRRLYLVQGLYSADAADFAVQADKFVDSFKLL